MSERTETTNKEKERTTRKRSASVRRTELFLRIRDGKAHLFDALVDELTEMLRRRLRSCSGTRALAWNQADVEDVLQHTFLRLWERRDCFDPLRGTIDGLAWIIARNAAVSVLRLRSRNASAVLLPDIFEDKRAAKADSELLAAEEQQPFAEALQRVKNPRARRALELHLVAGLPYVAVSKETGAAVGTIAGWIHKLRRSLRAA